jgi:FHA domain-containing protein
MEKIELRVEKLAGADVGRHWFAVFGVAGGTIGRGGQNKLVLPDADAGVARVHAMVRLESDAAYIANLCERRSMLVAGVEVLSGQEVQLHIGSEVQIGPYALRAVPPGTPATKAVMPSQRHMLAAAAPVVVAETLPATRSALASTPNPWADIPQQAWNEGGSASAASLSAPMDAGGASLDALLGASRTLPASPDAQDNPFAMLGRVELGGVSPLSAKTADLPDGSQTYALQTDPHSTSGLLPDQPIGTHTPVLRTAAANPPPAPETQSNKVPTPPLPNVFDGVGMPVRPAAAPPPNRPLLIPADFDPFARDVGKEAAAQDPWAGGLPGQSLSQVANIQSDELIRSLPLKGKLDEALDNPAHSGLPKGLDPKLETDPLRLFDTAGGLDGLTPENAQTARGPELVQVFNLPKGVEAGVRESRETPPSVAAHEAPRAPSEAAPLQNQRNDTPSVEAMGLLPTQGLDLAMFGGADVPVPPPVAKEASPASLRSVRDTASVSPKVNQPTLVEPTVHARADVSLPEKTAKPIPAAVVSKPSPASAVANDVTVDLNLDEATPVSPKKVVHPKNPVSDQSFDAQTLMDAFLEGAGLAPGRVEALMTPDFMRQFGEAFRVAVQGTIELLAARSEIKREFRADVTVIAPRANNPLKFLPNADGTMMQMVGQSFPGFMKPVPSMKEAYFDLQVHQLALMAGIRAAYAEALARFDPAELEKRCDANGGLLSKISTTARKAAVWDEYKKSYNAIRRHAEDDLVGFSGEAFVKAYDAAAEAAREKYP